MSLKEVKVFLYTLCSLALLAIMGIAQETAKPVPESAQNKLLKAQHAVDELSAKVKDFQFQYTQAQSTIKQIEAQFPTINTAFQAAQKELEGAREDAVKACGLDTKKFDADVNSMKCVPKLPSPPAAAPAQK